ncbi:MAG: ATP-binding protein [Neisseriaceae bacterium]|nr:ATP-binding protein [Neisseriaceae bacterium]
MKLILKNIGMLESAEVTLHRLCVIAGENDQGKSTIGKIVFCIVKAINRYKEDLQENKEAWVGEKIEEIYFFMREVISAGMPDKKREDALEALRNLRHFRMREPSLIRLDEVISQVFGVVEFTPNEREEVENLRNGIQKLLEQPDNAKQAIQNAFNKVFSAEFDASLLRHGEKEGSIQLVENDICLIHLEVKPKTVVLIGDVEPIVLKDATFIDSPLILNHHDLLVRSHTLLDVDKRKSGLMGLPYTTLHTKDLFNKLREPISPSDLFAPDTVAKAKFFNEIQSIIDIDGRIVYDRKKRDFIFQREDYDVSIKNTASGIKAFGILQILMANESIAKNTVLIFDEPENHVHPKWQLKMVELLLKLVEHGVYVMIASHSPYLIQALKRGVDRAGLASESRFALAQEKKIQDEDRLSDIFDALVEPFQVFDDMAAEDLRDE